MYYRVKFDNTQKIQQYKIMYQNIYNILSRKCIVSKYV